MLTFSSLLEAKQRLKFIERILEITEENNCDEFSFQDL